MPARWRKTAAAARLYGPGHREIRRQRAAAHRPGNPCAIGGEPLWQPVALLDLAHDHVNGGYLPGLACRYHNRAEGARRGNLMRGRGIPARRW
jgi:hypothetical protein